MSETAQHVVTDEEAGQRLDVLLASRFPERSRVRIRQLINAAEATVNTRRCKAAYRVRSGDVIAIRFPPQDRTGPEPEDIPLHVLHEDDRIIVVDKPPGMVVHPAKGHWSGTLTAALAFRFQNLSQVGGPTRPGIVHRLDRDTSGVIVIAKDDQAHLHLSGQFERREVQKEYFAVCRGSLDRDRDRIEQPIGPHPYQREKMAIRHAHPAARDASTYVEVDRRFRGFVSFRALPKTGRTHQIRVHLAHLGCPILCDPLYAGHRQITSGELIDGRPDDQVLLKRLALHARRLSIAHPDDERPLTFEAELPEEFNRLLAALEQHR